MEEKHIANRAVCQRRAEDRNVVYGAPADIRTRQHPLRHAAFLRCDPQVLPNFGVQPSAPRALNSNALRGLTLITSADRDRVRGIEIGEPRTKLLRSNTDTLAEMRMR